MNWNVASPRRLPRGGAQLVPGDPPAGPFSYTHRPTRRAGHARGGSRASGRIPQNPISMGLAKNRLTATRNPPRKPSARRPWGIGRGATEPNQPPRPFPPSPVPFPPSTLSLSSLPPRIPTDGRAGRGTPAGVPAPAVASRKTRFACVWLKIDSRAPRAPPTPGEGGGDRTPLQGATHRAATRHPRAQTAAPGSAPGIYPVPTLHLPCTYPAPTRHPPGTHPHFCSLLRPAFSNPRQAPAVNGLAMPNHGSERNSGSSKGSSFTQEFMGCRRVHRPNQVRPSPDDAIDQTLPPPNAHPAPAARADARRETRRPRRDGVAASRTRGADRPTTPHPRGYPAPSGPAALGSAPPTYPAPTLPPRGACLADEVGNGEKKKKEKKDPPKKKVRP